MWCQVHAGFTHTAEGVWLGLTWDTMFIKCLRPAGSSGVRLIWVESFGMIKVSVLGQFFFFKLGFGNNEYPVNSQSCFPVFSLSCSFFITFVKAWEWLYWSWGETTGQASCKPQQLPEGIGVRKRMRCVCWDRAQASRQVQPCGQPALHGGRKF